jgi:N-methylhydantoinase B
VAPSTSALLELEVFRALFASIAEEMGALLQRSAHSPNIKERRDFSCALFSARGELVAQAAHIPVHLGSAPLSVRAAMAEHAFQPGDSVLLNDPFRGGTHLPDLTLVSPVFLGQAHGSSRGRRPDFFVATRAHHADIGGAEPGSMAPARDLFGEGLVIPPVVLERSGRFERDVLRMVLANVRTPQERLADLRAQCASNRRGVARLQELAGRYGRARLLRAGGEILAHGERAMRALLRRLPRGTFRHEDLLDDDGMGTRDVPIRVAITLRGGSARIDWAGSAPQVAGSLNANPAITLSAVLYVFQCLAAAEFADQAGALSPNDGLGRPLELVIPEGSILSPRRGAAVAGGNVETSQRIVDVLLGALAKACPDRIPAASQGTMNNLTMGSHGGLHPFTYYETVGGGAGAGAGRPGASGIQVHMTNTLNTPIEALELAYPLRVTRTTIARGSGGRGAARGGDGIEREFEVLAPVRVAMLSERRSRGAPGAAGGSAGRPGRNFLVRSGREETMPAKFAADLDPHDRVGLRTPGGGGHGRSSRQRGR